MSAKVFPKSEGFKSFDKNYKFKKAVCIAYAGDPNEECKCGRFKNDHTEIALDNQIPQSRWNETDHIDKSQNTDAYGYLNFLGSSEIISRYIRVSNETNSSDMCKYLFDTDGWNFPKPGLVISVTGGAKLKINPHLREKFSQGLVKVATTTNALIVTGGSHNGCMQLVGEAFKNNALSIDLAKRIVLLGIANWGNVGHNEKLIRDEYVDDPECDKSVEYHMIKKKSRYKNGLLDPNHTHFILSDNGMVKFGGEVEFRTNVEAEIAKNHNISLVVLVIGGGPRTIDTVKSSAEKNSPCVFVEGSGDSADIIAYALKKFDEEINLLKKDTDQNIDEITISDNLKKKIEKKFTDAFKDKKQNDILQMVNKTSECLKYKNRKYFTICSSTEPIDVAILQALLQAGKNEENEKSSKNKFLTQLDLAMTWNRVDIAKHFIFTDKNKDQIGDLNELMYSAIKNDRIEFIQLFLENGFSLKHFVTYRLMLKLYNDLPSQCVFRKFLSKIIELKQKKLGNKFYLINRFQGIGRAIQKLTHDLYPHSYTAEPFASLNYNKTKYIYDHTGKFGQIEENTVGFLNDINDERVQKIDIDKRFDNPEHELFMYSVLTGRSNMARLFCYYGDYSIPSALIATIIFNSYAKLYEDEYDCYSGYAKDYENFANNLLVTYYNNDAERASQSLLTKIPIYDNLTCLQVAVASKCLTVIAHPCIQNILIKKWYDKILPDVSNKTLLLSVLCPFLAPKILSFEKKKLSEKEQAPKKKKLSDEELGNIPNDQSFSREKTKENLSLNQEIEDNDDDSKTSIEEYSYFKKFFYFVNMPFVKFFYYQVFFILFLILYSYVLLSDFYPIDYIGNVNTTLGLGISIPEITLIVWVFTFAIEKIREFSYIERKLLKAKIREYLLGLSNIFDTFTILGFITGEILRFIQNQNCYLAARIILSINIICWFLKSMSAYKFIKHVGPKLYMIRKMMYQLIYFLLIVVLFMFAFGVSTQALLYHNQALDANLLKNVFFPSYFIIGGEYYTIDAMLNPNPEVCTINPDASLTDRYTQNDCPETTGSIFGLIIYVVYLIFLNILLVNLLIAIFNNTYQLIETEATKIWKYDRYNLVFSYYYKPRLPPPLTIISYMLSFLRFLIRQLISNCKKSTSLNEKQKKGFVYDLKESDTTNLIKWEAYNTDAYIIKSEQELKENIEYKLDDNSKKLDDLAIKFTEALDNESSDMNEMVRKINTNIENLLKSLK